MREQAVGIRQHSPEGVANSLGQSRKLVEWRLVQRPNIVPFSSVGVYKIDSGVSIRCCWKCLVTLPLGTRNDNPSHLLCSFHVPGPMRTKISITYFHSNPVEETIISPFVSTLDT